MTTKSQERNSFFPEKDLITTGIYYYPAGVYMYWRDGFYIAVNYSSNNYTMSIPETNKILIGEKTLKPA